MPGGRKINFLRDYGGSGGTNLSRSAVLWLIVAMVLSLWGPSAVVATTTGAPFGDPINLWKTNRTRPPDCDTPVYTFGPAAENGSAAALIGDTRANEKPGCNPSFLFVDIKQAGAVEESRYCTVSFDASLWLVAGERTCVIVESGNNISIHEIPGTRTGRTGRYAVSVPGEQKVRLVFSVWNSIDPQNGTQSVLKINNVEVHITAEDITSTPLTPLHTDALPFVPASLDGYAVQRFDESYDCNANRIPDSFEVSQGLSVDGDSDGRPDECMKKDRKIDWVLLGMGVLILTVTLFRLARKNRSRS